MDNQTPFNQTHCRRQFLRGSCSSLLLSGSIGQVAGQSDSPDPTSDRSDSNLNKFIEQQALTSGGEDSGDKFGTSMDISDDGTTLVVGAIDDGTRNGSTTGAVYVFTRINNEWTEQQRIIAEDGESGDRFGISVSTTRDGDTVLIGANGVNGSKGAVYEFTHEDSGWVQQEKLKFQNTKRIGDTPSTPEISRRGFSDQFGTATEISNDGTIAFIGAPNYKSYNSTTLGPFSPDVEKKTGAVYLLEKEEQWVKKEDWYVVDTNTISTSLRYLTNRKTLEDITTDINTEDTVFGRSISLSDSGETALVSAEGDGRGSAYLFTKEGDEWSYENISPQKDWVESGFGTSISLTGDGEMSMVISPNEIDSDGRATGSAYIINNETGDRDRLTVEKDIDQDDSPENILPSEIGDGSGTISPDGRFATIASENGSLFLFSRDDGRWKQAQEITTKDENTGENFGYQTEFLGQTGNILTTDPFYNNKGAVFEFAEQKQSDSNNSTGSNLPGLGFGSAIIGVLGGGYLLYQKQTDE